MINNKQVKVFYSAIVISTLLFMVAISYFYYETERTISNIRVNNTEISVKQGNSNYLVFTENEGVLTVKDSLLLWSFNASDRFNKIKLKSTYNFTIIGWRIPILSMYPNIIKIDKIKPLTDINDKRFIK